jgi:hypothetical protein
MTAEAMMIWLWPGFVGVVTNGGDRWHCFGGDDLEVTGWLAEPWGIGGTSSGVKPAWLAELGSWALWARPRNPDGCVEATDCMFMLIHVMPGSQLRLEPERWVRVTGHFDDPASQSCVGSGPFWDPRSVPDPVAYCQGGFVVTAIHDGAKP